MRIALSAGHYPERPGATHDGLKEHNVAARFCAAIGSALLERGVAVAHINTGPLEDKVVEVNALKGLAGDPFDLAVEVHLNACGGCGATGAETLYMPGTAGAGRMAAEIIQREMAMAGARDRGAKAGYYRMDPANGPDYWLAKTRCPAVIVEPAFLDAEFPMDRAYEAALCEAIADGIAEFCRSKAS